MTAMKKNKNSKRKNKTVVKKTKTNTLVNSLFANAGIPTTDENTANDKAYWEEVTEFRDKIVEKASVIVDSVKQIDKEITEKYALIGLLPPPKLSILVRDTERQRDKLRDELMSHNNLIKKESGLVTSDDFMDWMSICGAYHDAWGKFQNIVFANNAMIQEETAILRAKLEESMKNDEPEEVEYKDVENKEESTEPVVEVKEAPATAIDEIASPDPSTKDDNFPFKT